MSKIEKADQWDVVFRDVREQPFVLEGYAWQECIKSWCRLPQWFVEEQRALVSPEPAVAPPVEEAYGAPVSARLLEIAHHTSGVAVRFRTDSPVVYLRATLRHCSDMGHITRVAMDGFDAYSAANGQALTFVGSAKPNHEDITPPYGQIFSYMGSNHVPGAVAEWKINFPLYGSVEKVEIGLVAGSSLEPSYPHKLGKVLFYGSSITQGACASRPGNSYASMICRALDAELINLGFSGSARGQGCMARLIASIKDLDAFVMDYDHNAWSPEHLEATHSKFYREVRATQPNLPIVIVSSPNCPNMEIAAVECPSPKLMERRRIIRQTYEEAIAAGDKHVYYVDGATLYDGKDPDSCTVDRLHPNDLGFYRMYSKILPVVREAIGER